MTLKLINPTDLPPQATYTQVVVAAGTTTVFIAGQEPEDVHGHSVAPGDLAGQARQVYANLGRALTAAGARPDQVAKITIYIVDYQPEHLPVIEHARVEEPRPYRVGTTVPDHGEQAVQIWPMAVN
jgi:enamine deaminase RidA (YjgF/YER057c/UK114 family)